MTEIIIASDTGRMAEPQFQPGRGTVLQRTAAAKRPCTACTGDSLHGHGGHLTDSDSLHGLGDRDSVRGLCDGHASDRHAASSTTTGTEVGDR